MGKYRAEFFSMLGWPLTEYFTDLPIPKVVIEFVAEDSLGKIYRLNIEALYEMTTYGLLFLPRSNPPYPLVISQHGGMGTPELCSGLIGPSNYNDMTRRVGGADKILDTRRLQEVVRVLTRTKNESR
jgi:hypothetical protein